jgi:hypothetical protein
MQWSSDYMSNLYAAEVPMLEQGRPASTESIMELAVCQNSHASVLTEYHPQVFYQIPLPVEVPQIQELSRFAILELLHFAKLRSDTYHQLYAKLARV